MLTFYVEGLINIEIRVTGLNFISTSYYTIYQILIEPHIMPFLPFFKVLRLRRELEGTKAEIFTWGCDGYDESIKQWSDSCDEQVVR